MKQINIGLWMYSNDGGDVIQVNLRAKLEALGCQVFNHFDLRKVMVAGKHIYDANQFDLSTLNVLYHMNAEERDEHQDTILQALEFANVKVVNSYQSYRLARDKFYANYLLRCANINVPPSCLLPAEYNRTMLQEIFTQWGQVLLKPRQGFCGKGIIKFINYEQFEDYYYSMKPYFKNYYLEKYIHFDDHDYRIEIIGDSVLGGYSRKKTHAFKSNVGAGATLIVNYFDETQINLAKRAVNVLGLSTSIVDMIKSVETGEYYVLEVNDSMGIFVEACLRSNHRLSADYLQPEYCYDDKKVSALADYLFKLANGGKNEANHRNLRDTAEYHN